MSRTNESQPSMGGRLGKAIGSKEKEGELTKGKKKRFCRSVPDKLRSRRLCKGVWASKKWGEPCNLRELIVLGERIRWKGRKTDSFGPR